MTPYAEQRRLNQDGLVEPRAGDVWRKRSTTWTVTEVEAWRPGNSDDRKVTLRRAPLPSVSIFTARQLPTALHGYDLVTRGEAC